VLFHIEHHFVSRFTYPCYRHAYFEFCSFTFRMLCFLNRPQESGYLQDWVEGSKQHKCTMKAAECRSHFASLFTRTEHDLVVMLLIHIQFRYLSTYQLTKFSIIFYTVPPGELRDSTWNKQGTRPFRYHFFFIIFQFLPAASMKVAVFWDVAPWWTH
jgi:hypothetical protein